jgi:alpha-tubulin suppressor-like RCC1 family protein
MRFNSILSAIPVLTLAAALAPASGGCASEVAEDDAEATEDAIIVQGASAQKIAAGYLHTCAIVAGGGVKCWGDNTRQQLGGGIAAASSVHPVDVLVSPGGPPLTGVKAIYAGWYSTCAIMPAGKVMCWGDNSHGQLGIGATTVWDRVRPHPVALVGAWDPVTKRDVPATGVKSIAITNYASCGIFADDSVKCWGKNMMYGQIENWPTAPKAESVLHAKSVELGFGHACARTTEGKVACWGEATDFKLGFRTARDVGKAIVAEVGINDDTPEGLPLQGVSDIAVGREHSCVLLARGRIRCWGLNRDGQLGSGDQLGNGSARGTGEVLVAPGGAPIEGATAIFASGARTCALFKGNKVLCWGDFFAGSAPRPVMSPSKVYDGPLTGLTAFTMGGGHACAVTRGGVVKCWGRNAQQQLGSEGDDPYSDTRAPRVVTLTPGGAPLIAR